MDGQSDPKPKVLEVVRVRATSGQSGGVDVRAIEFLQKVGFTDLKVDKYGDGRVHAGVPADNTSFLLEYNNGQDSANLPFQLVRVRQEERTIIDTGQTSNIQHEAGVDGTKEVTAAGEKMQEWLFNCREVVPHAPAPGDRPKVKEKKDEAVPVVREEDTKDQSPRFVETIEARVDEIVVFQKGSSAPEFAGQPRTYFDPNSLKRLGESLKRRQQQVITVIACTSLPGIKWELVDGERRWRAAQLVGIKTLWAVVTKSRDKKEQHLDAMVANLFRDANLPLEISDALQVQIFAGETVASLAQHLGMTVHEIRKLMSLQKIHPKLRPLLLPSTLKSERISASAGAILGKMVQARQEEVWLEARKQPTRGLVLRKLYELGKPHFTNKHEVGGSHNPSDVARSVERRLTSLAAVIKELEAFNWDECRTYAAFRGRQHVSADISRLTQAGSEIAAIKDRMSRARATVKDDSAGDNPK